MTTPTHNTTPIRQRLGKSTLFHGFIGALIAYPTMLGGILLGTITLNALEPVINLFSIHTPLSDAAGYFLLLSAWGVLPMLLSALIYSIRQWVLAEKLYAKIFVVYALVGLFAPTICFGLVFVYARVVFDQTVWMMLGLLSGGFILGVLCIQIEKRLNKTS